MGAIVGIFNRNGHEVDINHIKRMNNCISYIGKDGSAILNKGSIAFGHQMLHTTKESMSENLPFYDKSSRLIITADARIDNRDELSKHLNIENNYKVSDSFYILKSYQKWGENCTDKIIGDFAFAIWDINNDQLFCARDHVGVKPFYYYVDEKIFLFSTEIKSLITNPLVNYSLNEKKAAYYLLGSYDDREITFYNNISRLPAANRLIVTDDTFELIKYWSLDYNKKINLDSENEYFTSFRKIFNNAVKVRLRSAFPVGAMLSGGLDSSSIVCTARNMLMKNNNSYPLKTFSLIFDNTPEGDEREFINHVIKKGFIQPIFINADNYSPVFDNNPILWNNDEPNRAFNLYYDYLLDEAANKNSIRILLDGLGGDSTVSHGKGLVVDYLNNNNFKKAFNEINCTSKRLQQNKTKLFVNELILTCPDSFLIKFLNNNILKNNRNILNHDFQEYINEHYELLSKNKIVNLSDKAKEYHFNMLNSGLIQHTFEEINKITTYFNVEQRYPFYDVNLLEFCLAVPSEIKRKYGWDRFLMRQAMNEVLPKEIQWRENKKTGINSNIKNFISHDSKFIDAVLNDNEIIQKYVDIDLLQKLWEDVKKNQRPKEFFLLWNGISLALWLNQSNLNSKKFNIS